MGQVHLKNDSELDSMRGCIYPASHSGISMGLELNFSMDGLVAGVKAVFDAAQATQDRSEEREWSGS